MESSWSWSAWDRAGRCCRWMGLCCTGRQWWTRSATPSAPVTPYSPVYLAGGDDPARALATGIAWARNAIRTPGTSASASGAADYAAVTIKDRIDQDLHLDQELNRVGS